MGIPIVLCFCHLFALTIAYQGVDGKIADVMRQVRYFSCALCMLGSWGTRGGVLWKHQRGHFSCPHLGHDARLDPSDFTAEGSRCAGMSGTALMTLLDLDRTTGFETNINAVRIECFATLSSGRISNTYPRLHTCCRSCFCSNVASRSTTSEEVLKLCRTQYGTTHPG